MMRYDLINGIIQDYSYESYLEIGHRDGNNFGRIKLKDKTSVDPTKSINPKIPCDNVMTSDEFFSKNTKKFDVIFIDGLHHADQVRKDIKNAEKALAPLGTIVVHDCNPIDKNSQIVPQTQSHWNGDVWKALVEARINSPFKICTVDMDQGCGVLQRASDFIDIPYCVLNEVELTWEEFEKNRDHWLNLVSYDLFKQDGVAGGF